HAMRETELALLRAPRVARRMNSASHMTPAEALAAATAECIEHIARNAEPLAAVWGTPGAGRTDACHARQLRAGLRRLLGAWRLCRHAGGLPPAPLRVAA